MNTEATPIILEGNISKGPLWDAIDKADVDAVMRALLSGADPNLCIKDDWSPLHQATLISKEKIARILLRHGANPNSKNYPEQYTPLHLAAMRGDVITAVVLWNYGANVEIKDRKGKTPYDYSDRKLRHLLFSIIEFKKKAYSSAHPLNYQP